MPVSGNIGDTIQFQVTGANSVTGVKFGSGQANFNKISETVLDTTVPQTATYGKVIFEKNDSIETFDITATGDGDSGAYSSLTGVINTSGFFSVALSGCTTGDVTFTDYNTASGICVITATGSSLAQASGLVVSGHESGYCGGPTGFTTGDYTISETRLGAVTASALGASDNFVAFATVEYTGNLNVKQAAVSVTCNESGIQSETTDNFVTLSRINSFSVVPSGGGTIDIFGNALSSITGVNLGTGLALSFSGDNTTLNAVVPTGEYEDFLYFDLYSGLSVVSQTKYITSGEVTGANKEQPFILIPNQSITAVKGETGNAILNGSGLSGVSSFKFRSKQSVEVTPASFTARPNQITASLSGLSTGLHDVIVEKSGVSLTGENFVQITDQVSHSYGYETFMSSGINYIGEESSEGVLSGVLNSFTYGILTTGDADRISFQISGANISSGNITFSLSKKSDVTKTVNSLYTVKGRGLNSGASVTNAYNNFNSGIYSEGEFGAYDPNVSYKISERVCDITSQTTSSKSESNTFTSTGTYTGTVTGNPLDLPAVNALELDVINQFNAYTGENLFNCVVSSDSVTSGAIGTTATGSGVNISASGFVSGDNLTKINNRISDTGDYSGYTLISTTVETIDNFEAYSYSSGISFPFATSDINNTSSQHWVNIVNSGLNELYPAGWTGQDSLTSGIEVVTGSSAGSTTLTFSGKTIEEVNNLIGEEIQDNRSYCSTGDPSYYLTGEIINLTGIRFFSGYC